MEKISAACAMDWSIELEKGLRSGKPGAAVEAVRRMGPRLEQWGREPNYTMAAYSMFGLVPGEDRLFASAIFLKLAEAFRVGDKGLRRAVVDLFSSDLKRRGREGVCAIFSKCTEENCLELLRRVKDVFDKEGGDIEVRADCLVLFGCWAAFAGENADVRHLILTSLASVHDMEVKATLFAAGCFCEQSDDFANVVLHILINFVTSIKTSSNLKLAGIRIFGKMQHSFLMTQKAYKAALTLMDNLPDEDALVVLLKTLTKLASKSTLLIVEQVNLLCSVLNQETTLRTKVTALKSLSFIYSSRGYFHISAQLIESLLGLLLHPQVQDDLQYEALEILQKIFSLRTLNMSLMDMIKSSKLFDTLQSVCQSRSSINRVLALEIMAGSASKLIKGIEDESSKVSLLSYVISLIVEQITVLCLQGLDDISQIDSEKERAGLSLIKILVLFVRKHPNHCTFVVDKICLLIERMLHEGETIMDASQPGLPVHNIEVPNVNMTQSVRSKLLHGTCRVLSACLCILFEMGAVNTGIIGKVISTLKLACEINYGSCLSMLDVPYQCWATLFDKDNCLVDKKAIWDECLSGMEILALECSKNLLAAEVYWPAYRYGVRAAYRGVYTVLIFIFEHLMTKVQSGIYLCWLKTLVEFAYSEWEAEQLCLPKPSTGLEDWLKTNSVGIVHPWRKHNMGQVARGASLKTEVSVYSRKLSHTLSNLCSARKTLESGMTSYKEFYFQRWFLALKVKLKEAVVEFLRIMSFHVPPQDRIGYANCSLVMCTTSGQYVPWSGSVSHLYSRLKRLALEFDLMLTSLVDMDTQSMSIISALSLSSSVLAFSARYFLVLPEVLPRVSGCSVSTDNFSDFALVHNLLNRLSHIDEQTAKNIGILSKAVSFPEGCFHLPSRTQMLVSFRTQELISICNLAMTGVASLQNENNSVSQIDDPSEIANTRLKLMSDITMRWLAIPFHIPKSFFHCRPVIGSEIFVMNADPRKPDCLSTTVGSCLALNICVQLKNFPRTFSARIKNLFCILQCKPSYQVPNSNDHIGVRTRSALPAWEVDYLIDLNQKLMHHVTECKVTKSSCEETADQGSVYAYTCLEVNEKYQGFSPSMLDVSGFPTGSYETRWLSCYVDYQGSYWSMLPLNVGPIITVKNVDEIPNGSAS